MTWRYIAAVCHEFGEEPIWQVHELYTGDRVGWTRDAIPASGATREELIEDLKHMLADVERGGLIDLDADTVSGVDL